jgi:hypothetical protein
MYENGSEKILLTRVYALGVILGERSVHQCHQLGRGEPINTGCILQHLITPAVQWQAQPLWVVTSHACGHKYEDWMTEVKAATCSRWPSTDATRQLWACPCALCRKHAGTLQQS